MSDFEEHHEHFDNDPPWDPSAYECPECHGYFPPTTDECPECGYVPYDWRAEREYVR